ncbi:MAG TPA: NAD(P)-binding domain-containing protein [Gammaproteobacteria bacterium]|nr:NAD(P)-binding domain-containing protein [Gammaproteobacteria bacterium]
MRIVRAIAVSAAALLLVSLSPTAAFAAKIAVIGSGNVANALGPGFAAQGNTIVYGSRNPAEQKVKDLVAKTGHGASAASQQDAVKGADIVVLAVPGTAAGDVVKGLGDLSGKIILDPTNLVNRSNPDGNLDYPKPANAASNAELIQSLAPKAKVVKAFNTLNVGQMTNPASAGGPITIPICGDDAQAKATVAQLVKGMGLEVVDLGPLRYANALEQMLVIWGNARAHGQPYNYYFRPQPPAPPQSR